MLIRPLTTIDECRRVAALEREIWGIDDAVDVLSPLVLVASIKRGAILLGAFDDAGRLAGFAYSTPAVKGGELTQWSHALGVMPDARDSGAGRRLKLAQREAALAMGIGLIEWTFDPLQALNAHFNFARLGVLAEEYDEDAYGTSNSPLHGGAPTDRLVVQWQLREPHVQRRIATDGLLVIRDRSIAAAPLVNPSAGGGGPSLIPGRADLTLNERRLLVEIPAGFGEMLRRDPPLALAWRLHTREIFQSCLRRGYRVVDFFLAREAGRGHYLLARRDDPA